MPSWLWLLFTLLLPATFAHAQLKIVTTAPDYADIAKQIGGDKVTVHSVMKGPENVHNVMAKPTEMVFLNQADLFVHSGLDTEPWRDNLLKGARNPRVLPGKPGNVDMSTGIELKEVPIGKIDRSEGDVHSYGNPHYTLNPQIAQRMAVTLVKAMCDVDPANASLYKASAIKFVNSMTDLSRELRATFAPYTGLKVVTFHKAWEYFADAVPIEIVGTIEPKPAITPSPAQVQQTIQLMKDQHVKVVICETYDDSKLAQHIADAVGAKMIVLPDHVNGVPEASSYQELFRYDVKKLIEAAGGK
ncbi:MAG TPA: metal ABC transporter substrate-binding protein [Tepidisphaeraceae bacterium]|nr:metal ABC transporter substrate-binding protein [Tepidisphaeraceae bacterium]